MANSIFRTVCVRKIKSTWLNGYVMAWKCHCGLCQSTHKKLWIYVQPFRYSVQICVAKSVALLTFCVTRKLIPRLSLCTARTNMTTSINPFMYINQPDLAVILLKVLIFWNTDWWWTSFLKRRSMIFIWCIKICYLPSRKTFSCDSDI